MNVLKNFPSLIRPHSSFTKVRLGRPQLTYVCIHIICHIRASVSSDRTNHKPYEALLVLAMCALSKIHVSNLISFKLAFNRLSIL